MEHRFYSINHPYFIFEESNVQCLGQACTVYSVRRLTDCSSLASGAGRFQLVHSYILLLYSVVSIS